MPAMSYCRPACRRTNSMSARQRPELHRKRRRGLLATERQLQFFVTAVDPDAIARNVRRREKGKAHDVVPVHVGHEDVIRLRRRGAMARERLLAERTHARAEVAQHVLGAAGLDLDAGGVPAVAPGDRQSEAVDEGCPGRRRKRRSCRTQRAAPRSPCPGRRPRSARPEGNRACPRTVCASCRRRRRRPRARIADSCSERRAHVGKDFQDVIEAGDGEDFP